MPVQIYGVAELALNLRQLSEKTSKALFEGMLEMGEEIAERARDYAPVDEGDLESAIQTDVTNRDGSGRFIKREVSVFINTSLPVSTGGTVGNYAMFIHEHLEPYGTGLAGYLGKRSVAKDGGRGIVGGKFLERAVLEVSVEKIETLRALVSSSMKSTLSTTKTRKK